MTLTKEDLQAIGDLIDSRLEEKLEENNKKLEEKLDARFEENNKRLEEKLDARFEENNKRLEEKLDARFEENNKRLEEKLDARFEARLDAALKPIYDRLTMLELKENLIHKKLDNLSLDVKVSERSIRRDIRVLQDGQETLSALLEQQNMLPTVR